MKLRLLICLFLFLSLQAYSQCTLSVSVAASSQSICSGNSVTLTATASQGKPPYSYVWNTGQTTPSISVNKGGTYTVTVTDKSSGCQPVNQSITVTAVQSPSPPTINNVVVCPNTSATLTPTGPGGTYQWYDAGGKFLASGDNYTTPPITTTTYFYVQTTINGCTSIRTPVQVSLPSNPVVMGDTVCQGNVATLIARKGDSYDWYNNSSGGSPISTDSMYTTPPLTTTTTYYVVVNLNGCSSARTPVTATVTAAPAAPTASNVTICSGNAAQLHASGSATEFDWYNVPSGGTSLISSPDYTTPPLTATTTYYVQTSQNGCSSARVPVTVTVDEPPAAPTAQTDSICYNSSTTLTASTTPSGTYTWYTAAVGGTQLATGNTYTTPVLVNSTAYFVQAVNGSCSTSRVQINVIVKPQLPPPSTPGAIICYGTGATLTTNDQGGTYQWYSAATGGTPLATGTSYSTPSLTTTTTYYVQRTLEGCISPREAVTVTVEPQSAAPTAAGTTICSGNTATLTATSSDNIYAWYNSPGGTLLSTSQVYVTPALTATTTYYVQTTSSSGCNSPFTAVKVTVNPTPAQPTASGTTICPGTSTTLTASAPPGTSIEWYGSSSGGTPLATGSTYNTPVINSTTTYYVQGTNGTCTSSRAPVTVSVTASPNPEFQYSSGSYCVSGPNATPVINNPSGGAFSASPAGLVFVSNTTGEINVSASTPGNYVVSFANNAPCPGTTSEPISIVTSFSSNFSYNSPFCQDGPNPSPTFSGGAVAGTFTATPSGLVFVNTSTGEIDLTNSAPGTYTVTNTASSTSCGSSTTSIMVTIDPRVIVSAGPNQTVPTGSTVQLAGSISGGTTTGTWSGGTGTFSNTSNPNATYTPGPGETSAVLTLTSSKPAGPCGAQSSTVTITFGTQTAAPTAKGETICSNNTANLSATAPGGTYQWFNVPTGGTPLYTGPSFTTPVLTSTTDYYVETTVNGITSNRTEVIVTVTSSNAPTAISGDTVICQGTSTTLTATGPASTYLWYSSATGGNQISTGSTYNTPVLNANTSFFVQAASAQCSGTRTQVNVTVSPTPNIISLATGIVCSGTPLNYTITSDQPAANFNWSRAAVAGISNPAVTNQTSPTITETLINTTVNPIKVTYSITPSVGSCTGPVFNYVVTVYPTPQVTSANSSTVCDDSPINYTVTFNDPSVTFSWSRAAVAGISNAAVSGQTVGTIKEVLHNTTDQPVQATYLFDYKNSNCSGTPFSYVVTVNPTATITSNATGTACSGVPQNYAITSNITSATFTWSRAAAPGISNPAVTNQTSSTITEALVNTNGFYEYATYIITPSANGCTGTPFSYVVKVSPSVATPKVNSNSPVCVGSTVSVSTTAVIGATYLWTKPDGSIITTTTPTLNIDDATTANSGAYTLINIVNGCQSQPVTVNVKVDEPADANAGANQTVCKYAPTVQLQGSVTGGTTTGIWSSSGSGTFSPSNTALNATYISSAQDVQQDSIILTLTSTSTDNCPPSVSTMVVKYGPLPGVSAGPDLAVCSQDASVPVTGKLFTTGTVSWSTLGSGNFTNPHSLTTDYDPSAADTSAGSVKLVIQLVGNDQCYINTDTMTIHFIPPAKVYAGGIRYVLKGNTVTLTPKASEDSLTYLWSPDIDINNIHLMDPTVTGDVNRTYTVTVTDPRGCTSSDTVYVEVSPPINIDNTFTPNGDGINDTWNITGLIAYVNATVDIYNRYGQPVFHSRGYPVAWNGTYNGQPLPVGVYYYVIRLNFNNIVLSGPVTILR